MNDTEQHPPPPMPLSSSSPKKMMPNIYMPPHVRRNNVNNSNVLTHSNSIEKTKSKVTRRPDQQVYVPRALRNSLPTSAPSPPPETHPYPLDNIKDNDIFNSDNSPQKRSRSVTPNKIIEEDLCTLKKNCDKNICDKTNIMEAQFIKKYKTNCEEEDSHFFSQLKEENKYFEKHQSQGFNFDVDSNKTQDESNVEEKSINVLGQNQDSSESSNKKIENEPLKLFTFKSSQTVKISSDDTLNRYSQQDTADQTKCINKMEQSSVSDEYKITSYVIDLTKEDSSSEHDDNSSVVVGVKEPIEMTELKKTEVRDEIVFENTPSSNQEYSLFSNNENSNIEQTEESSFNNDFKDMDLSLTKNDVINESEEPSEAIIELKVDDSNVPNKIVALTNDSVIEIGLDHENNTSVDFSSTCDIHENENANMELCDSESTTECLSSNKIDEQSYVDSQMDLCCSEIDNTVNQSAKLLTVPDESQKQPHGNNEVPNKIRITGLSSHSTITPNENANYPVHQTGAIDKGTNSSEIIGPEVNIQNSTSIQSALSTPKKVSTIQGAPMSTEVCDWESLYDDDGECLVPNILNELVDKMGKVSVKRPSNDYKDFQSVEERTCDGESILEIYDFSSTLTTRDLMEIFAPFQRNFFEIKWVDDTHALGLFSSPVVADEVLNTNLPNVKTRPLKEGIATSKSKAKFLNLINTPMPRPKTCIASARRLVSGALGIRLEVSESKREAERKVLRDAREKKRQVAKQREEIWGKD